MRIEGLTTTLVAPAKDVTKKMIKVASILTLVLIFGAVVGGLLSLPGNDAMAAREGVTAPCPMRQVALDEGYGVTRTEMRPVCGAP